MGDTISMKEIAVLAGVSISTVSRVLNKNGRFSNETEARVRAITQKYNYMPNLSAKSLRTNRSSVVGVVIPDITNSHFSQLVRALEAFMFEQGYSCLICNTNENTDLEKRHVQSLLAQNVSGIFIAGTHVHDQIKSIPVIYMDRRPIGYNDNFYMIASNNTMGGYLATKELLQKGCRHLAIIMGRDIDHNQFARFEGFQRAIHEQGITQKHFEIINTSDALMGTSENAVIAAIDGGLEFDGLMCTTDTLAAGAVIGLRKRNVSVPRDVLVTGFDDSPIAAVVGMGLTSVRQDVEKMTKTAVDLFLKMLENDAPKQMEYSIPVALTLRDSTRRI